VQKKQSNDLEQDYSGQNKSEDRTKYGGSSKFINTFQDSR